MTVITGGTLSGKYCYEEVLDDFFAKPPSSQKPQSRVRVSQLAATHAPFLILAVVDPLL